MSGLTIGKVAKQTDVGIETIWFYERQGLIEPPPRTDSGYRMYPRDTIDRLQFIKRAKDLGFSLNEIKELLALHHNPDATKADIKKKAIEKIGNVRRKIDDLSRILHALEHLSEQCNGHGPIEECPILEALSQNCSHGHCHHQ